MDPDQCMDLHLGVAMADWVRNTVMLTVLAIWTVYVTVTLARGDDIDAIVWGVPATAYFALNPSWKKGSKDGPS
jgi:hypothetical protein